MAENRFAHGAPSPEAATDEPASPPSSQTEPERLPDGGGTIPDFEPVPLRYRQDGLTPEKQREYVEALADCGVAREAAGRIGVSEQAVNRARRRADARSFDLACEAAVRIAARRIRSIAFERAIEGTIRRHYYHGELKSEEVVHDNRLLIYLLGKVESQLAPPKGAAAVAANWDSWMEAIEQGLPEPPRPKPETFTGDEVWEDEDGWWTRFPPPEGFDGHEEGEPGGYGYRRQLTAAEQAVIDADHAAEHAEYMARESARRDLYFGFAEAPGEGEIFSPKGPETSETSGRRPPDE